jgi:hypothetical protein
MKGKKNKHVANYTESVKSKNWGKSKKQIQKELDK